MGARIETVEYVGVSDARKDISKLIEDAAKKGHRIAITRHDTPIAAIVPYADLEALERSDDAAFETMDAERDDERATRAQSQKYSGAGIALNALPSIAAMEDVVDCLPMGKGSADRNAFFLAGQIIARIKDADLNLSLAAFQTIQTIVGRTLHDTFDQTTTPNFPKASPAYRRAAAAATVAGHVTITGGDVFGAPYAPFADRVDIDKTDLVIFGDSSSIDPVAVAGMATTFKFKGIKP